MVQGLLAGLIVIWALLYLAGRFMPQALRTRLGRLHPALRTRALPGACAACSSCGSCTTGSGARPLQAAEAAKPPQRPVIWLSQRE